MIALQCPFCHVHSTFAIEKDGAVPAFLKDLIARAPGYEHEYKYHAMRCQNARCQMLVSAIVRNDEAVLSFPATVGGKEFPDVPGHIASVADEAHKCFSISAFRGAVALARAVVEATAKNKGIKKGLLSEKIDKMAELGVITSEMREAADEIRLAGNDVAHGDLAEEAFDKDEVEEILELMDTILMRVYQEPERTKRVRESRKARKAASTAPEPANE